MCYFRKIVQLLHFLLMMLQYRYPWALYISLLYCLVTVMIMYDGNYFLSMKWIIGVLLLSSASCQALHRLHQLEVFGRRLIVEFAHSLKYSTHQRDKCVFVCVCMYPCMSVFVYACLSSLWLCVCMYVCMHARVFDVYIHACVHVCMYVLCMCAHAMTTMKHLVYNCILTLVIWLLFAIVMKMDPLTFQGLH